MPKAPITRKAAIIPMRKIDNAIFPTVPIMRLALDFGFFSFFFFEGLPEFASALVELSLLLLLEDELYREDEGRAFRLELPRTELRESAV